MSEGWPCSVFQIDEPIEAARHMSYRTMKDYGSRAGGHYLYVGDDGHRALLRCNTCGGYLLAQFSEFHRIDADDEYMVSYFPVSGDEEAKRLNAVYSGVDLERRYRGRYLIRHDISEYTWHEPMDEEPDVD